MSFLSVFDQKKEKKTLIVDIGSGNVSAAITTRAADGHATVLKRVRMSYTIDQNQVPDRTGGDSVGAAMTESGTDSMTGCLSAVLTQLLSDTVVRHTVSDVHIAFSPPWSVSRTTEVHLKQEKKFIITQKFLSDIVQTQVESFSKELKNELQKEENTSSKTSAEDSVAVIEHAVLHTRVNGYRVADCIGMKTDTFDLAVVMSWVSQSALDAVLELVHAQTHKSPTDIHTHTFSFISYAVMSTISPVDYMFMDVLGETTTISVVRSDTPEKSMSFPSGTYFIIRQIEKALKVSPELALSTLRIALSGKADTGLSEQMQSVFALVEKEWAIYFEDALVSLDPHCVLPSKIFLSVPADLAPVYQEFLALPKSDATAVYRKNISIVPVTAELLAPVYTHNPQELFDAHVAVIAASTVLH